MSKDDGTESPISNASPYARQHIYPQDMQNEFELKKMENSMVPMTPESVINIRACSYNESMDIG